MRQFWRTIFVVALLASAIGSYQHASGRRDTSDPWVRTAQGWQRRHMLQLRPRPTRVELHPAVVASLQLGVSLLGLIALPSRVASTPQA